MLAGISKPLIFVVISVLVVALIYGSFTPFIVFAVPPSGGFNTSTECTTDFSGTLTKVTCCWREHVDPGTGNPDLGGNMEKYCQTCTNVEGGYDLDDPELQFLVGTTPGLGALPEEGVLEQPPTTPPSGPAAPLQGGVLEQLEEGDFAPGFAPGFLQQQEQLPPAEQGAAELPPPSSTEETKPATAEEEQPVPVCQDDLEFNEDLGFCVPTECPEGQELNEETGICVLEEQTVEQQEQEQAAGEEPEEEEQQQTEEEQPSEGTDSEGDDDSNN